MDRVSALAVAQSGLSGHGRLPPQLAAAAAGGAQRAQADSARLGAAVPGAHRARQPVSAVRARSGTRARCEQGGEGAAVAVGWVMMVDWSVGALTCGFMVILCSDSCCGLLANWQSVEVL